MKRCAGFASATCNSPARRAKAFGLRLVFLGNDAWSVPSLEALAASIHEVALVVTHDPRPAGRGNELRPTMVADAAHRLGVPLLEVPTVKEGAGFAALEQAAPAVLVVVAYGEILPRPVLDVPQLGVVNLHFSLLPKLRGAGPVQHALLEGLTETGTTTMLLDEGMDTGDILMQRAEPVASEDDAGTLGGRLAVAGAGLLVETVNDLENGTVHAVPQDSAAATFAPKLGAGARTIDWMDSAEIIARKIRALAPSPAATTKFRGKVLKVFRAEIEPPAGRAGSGDSAGSFVSAGAGDVFVATGTAPIRLVEVALEGRKRMPWADFVRGHRPEPAEKLG